MAKKKTKSNSAGTAQIVGGVVLLFISFLIYIFGTDIHTLLCSKGGLDTCSLGEGLQLSALLLLVIVGVAIAGAITLGVGIFRMIRSS